MNLKYFVRDLTRTPNKIFLLLIHIELLCLQLNERYSQSTEQCKKFYYNKIKQLQENTDQILLSWKDMEMRYTNINSSDTTNTRSILKTVRK